MSSPLCKYIASKLLEDLRSGCIPDKELAESIDALPQIDYVRSAVTRADLPGLFRMAQSFDRPIRGLALSLLRAYSNDQEVKEFLGRLWDERTDYDTRWFLMWRILDDPELEANMHRRVYTFVRENWDRWLCDCTRFHGGPDALLASLRSRLKDPSFPPSKHWAYLAACLGSPQGGEARALLLEYADSKASIVADVVADLLSKLDVKAV
jgi:hypothetical protein